MGREEYEQAWENWRRAGVSWCGKGLGWNFEVRECPGAVLGSRNSRIKTQHCWDLLATVVTAQAGPELGQRRWNRSSTTSEGIRVFWLFPSHQLYESHPKNLQVIPFPADSGTGQQPPASACYSIKPGVGFNSSRQPCWGAMWVSICCIKRPFFFCFKSRKHCTPKTMKVSISKIKVVHSVIQLILPNGIGSFCHLLTFSCSALQPECSFKIALCMQ